MRSFEPRFQAADLGTRSTFEIARHLAQLLESKLATAIALVTADGSTAKVCQVTADTAACSLFEGKLAAVLACIGRAVSTPSIEAVVKFGRMVAVGVVAKLLGHTVLALVEWDQLFLKLILSPMAL